MHPDLDVRSIRLLPVNFQSLTSTAAAASRTFLDVLLVKTLSHTDPLSASQRSLLLPVWFANLDLEKIPTSDQLEDMHGGSAIVEDIQCAIISVDSIMRLRLKGDVGTSLWPRVWGWFEFLEMHRNYLSAADIPLLPEIDAYCTFITFVSFVRVHPATYDLMSTTPQFWGFIVEAWSLIPQMDDTAGEAAEAVRAIMLHVVAQLLVASKASPDSQILAEMIEAAGSIDHLARLVLEFIRVTITEPLPDSASPASYLQNLLFFAIGAGVCQDKESDMTSRRLISALCELDLNRELLSVIFFLCDRSDPDAWIVLGLCVWLMRYMVNLSRPNMWLDALLQRGLLRALILVTHRAGIDSDEVEPRLREPLRAFLRDVTSGLVYYRPIITFEKAFKEAQGSISADTFKDHPLSADWKHFLTATRDLLDALEGFHSPSFRTLKACDNLECGSIGETNAMAGRCSGCHTFYYCSQECQKIDWKAGHRNCCASHSGLLLAEHDDPNLSFKERSFLRALVHHKYLKERRSICFKQVQVLAAHPADSETSPLLFTLFNFDRCPPVVKVHEVGNLPKRVADLVGTDSAEWTDIVERAERDGGYTQLHGLCVRDGKRPRVWVIPLRTNIPLIHEGLKALADRVRLGELSDKRALLREIRRVLDEEVTEIH
ncbi:hypothetical protein FB45DRAFT_1064583 [Roridomyces roridus]|uniref:MYND-type domain-containing protein n=1 Tax=Roridomyces roridus TaxID=1738132 RepID=A0AAD7BAM7_9AGAR|nr:hypothetical protein FB45DRAFT_1064583 [Roridomyces roridus]